MRNMFHLVFFVVFLFAAVAVEGKGETPQKIALKETDAVKLENYQLKITLIERQLQSMRSGAERWIMALFNKYSLSPKEWRFDVQKRVFIKVTENE